MAQMAAALTQLRHERDIAEDEVRDGAIARARERERQRETGRDRE